MTNINELLHVLKAWYRKSIYIDPFVSSSFLTGQVLYPPYILTVSAASYGIETVSTDTSYNS